jgi:hypothetical protein
MYVFILTMLLDYWAGNRPVGSAATRNARKLRAAETIADLPQFDAFSAQFDIYGLMTGLMSNIPPARADWLGEELVVSPEILHRDYPQEWAKLTMAQREEWNTVRPLYTNEVIREQHQAWMDSFRPGIDPSRSEFFESVTQGQLDDALAELESLGLL